MLAAAISTPVELARRCGVDVVDVQDWMASNGESLRVRDLMQLRLCLKVRARWLLSGQKPMGTEEVRSEQEAEALEILHALSPEKAEKWLKLGRMVAGE